MWRRRQRADASFSLYYAYYAGITLAVFVSILGALFVCYEPLKKLGGGDLRRVVPVLEQLGEGGGALSLA